MHHDDPAAVAQMRSARPPSRGADDPQVEHLRWQIASLERQARWREDAAGMFGTAHRAASTPSQGGRAR